MWTPWPRERRGSHGGSLAHGVAEEVPAQDFARVVHLQSVDEIGDPKKSSGHYEVSIRHFYTLYSVNKTLLDAI